MKRRRWSEVGGGEDDLAQQLKLSIYQQVSGLLQQQEMRGAGVEGRGRMRRMRSTAWKEEQEEVPSWNQVESPNTAGHVICRRKPCAHCLAYLNDGQRL